MGKDKLIIAISVLATVLLDTDKKVSVAYDMAIRNQELIAEIDKL